MVLTNWQKLDLYVKGLVILPTGYSHRIKKIGTYRLYTLFNWLPPYRVKSME